MPDVDAAIREWLRPVPTVDEWGEWMHRTHGALTVVLDVHKPRVHHDGRRICDGCSDPKYGVLVFAPCETVRAIAGKLGVEVPDA